MNKVSWTSRDDLYRATTVVLTTVVLMAIFLFGSTGSGRTCSSSSACSSSAAAAHSVRPAEPSDSARTRPPRGPRIVPDRHPGSDPRDHLTALSWTVRPSSDTTAWRRMSHPTDETPNRPPRRRNRAADDRRPSPTEPARRVRGRGTDPRRRRPPAGPTGAGAGDRPRREPSRDAPPQPASAPTEPRRRPTGRRRRAAAGAGLVRPEGPELARGHDPRRPGAAGQDPGAAALLRPDRGPHREDHRDPQQQEADRRAEDLPRLHHGRDGAEREDLVRGPRDARASATSSGPTARRPR